MKLDKPEKISLTFLTLLVLLIAAIYFPGFITSKTAAQEMGANRNLVKLYEAELIFFQQRSRYGSLDELIDAELIEKDFSMSIKGGYRFEIENRKDGFEVYATPIRYGRNSFTADGRLSLYINEKRILTYADKQGARASVEDKQF